MKNSESLKKLENIPGMNVVIVDVNDNESDKELNSNKACGDFCICQRDGNLMGRARVKCSMTINDLDTFITTIRSRQAATPFDKNFRGKRPAKILDDILIEPGMRIDGMKRAYVQGNDLRIYQVIIIDDGNGMMPAWRVLANLPIVPVDNVKLEETNPLSKLGDHFKKMGFAT